MPDLPDLHVLIRRHTESGETWWTAQCLELDLCAQAKSLDDLEFEFSRVFTGRILAGQQLGVDPFENIGQAPPELWAEWDRARRIEMESTRPYGTSPPANVVAPSMIIAPKYEARVYAA